MNSPVPSKEIKVLVKISPTKEALAHSFSGKSYQTYKKEIIAILYKLFNLQRQHLASIKTGKGTVRESNHQNPLSFTYTDSIFNGLFFRTVLGS